MPRGFSDHEKEAIRNKLLHKGEELFITHGIRKTNVEDLTQAAGISKGAFYRFFASKEELFLEILEQREAEMRERIFDAVLRPGESAREGFKRLLREAFAFWETSVFLQSFDRADFETLVRRIPEERVAAHIRRDETFVAQVCERWQQEGVAFKADPQTISGLMLALFFVSLHREDLGQNVYPRTMDILIDLVAGYLIDG